jgi:hypothetical protein
VSQEINAKELDAKRKDQERVTRPLHPEDMPLFLREGAENQKAAVQDKQDANC